MAIARRSPDLTKFNPDPALPYELRIADFQLAMQDVYDFFYDVNLYLSGKGLSRLDDMLRGQAMSGMLSDMLTNAMSKHARVLTQNMHHNGHPDLIVKGHYAKDATQSGEHGVEVKSTSKWGGAVDTHGARNQWLCVFVYQTDNETEPATAREPMKFREVYIAKVEIADFRLNNRGPLGTRTATLHRHGLPKLRAGWVYLDKD